jgi:hypothetical protein
LRVHGLCFLLGLRVADGELVGECIESIAVVAVGLGLGVGKANVGAANADDVADALGSGEVVSLEEEEELGSGLGVANGGMTFSQ